MMPRQEFDNHRKNCTLLTVASDLNVLFPNFARYVFSLLFFGGSEIDLKLTATNLVSWYESHWATITYNGVLMCFEAKIKNSLV